MLTPISKIVKSPLIGSKSLIGFGNSSAPFEPDLFLFVDFYTGRGDEVLRHLIRNLAVAGELCVFADLTHLHVHRALGFALVDRQRAFAGELLVVVDDVNRAVESLGT